MPSHRFRSSVTGRWVTALFAKLFPRETQREEVKDKPTEYVESRY